jgi:hypothetical protein
MLVLVLLLYSGVYFVLDDHFDEGVENQQKYYSGHAMGLELTWIQ